MNNTSPIKQIENMKLWSLIHWHNSSVKHELFYSDRRMYAHFHRRVPTMAMGDHQQPLLLSTSEETRESSDSVARRCHLREAWVECWKLWQLAAPSIFCRLSMFSLTIITQSFAGHLGEHQLAAISVVTTVIIGITFGFLVTLFVSLWLDFTA